MDVEWTRRVSSRKGGGRGKDSNGSQVNILGKQAWEEEEEEVREIRKKMMMEEFKIILNFKPGHETASVSPIALATGLKWW